MSPPLVVPPRGSPPSQSKRKVLEKVVVAQILRESIYLTYALLAAVISVSRALKPPATSTLTYRMSPSHLVLTPAS